MVAKQATDRFSQSDRQWLQMHGNVSYDFFYRSAVDTPYADRNIMQHTVSTRIYATLKKSIPVVVEVNARQGNSYLFRNYLNANVQFDGQAYRSLIKQNLFEKVQAFLSGQSAEKELQAALQEQYNRRQKLRSWLQDGKQLQQLVESRRIMDGFLPETNWSSIINKEKRMQALMDRMGQTFRQNDQAEKFQNYLQQARKFKPVAAGGYNPGATGLRSSTSLPENVVKAVVFLKEYAGKKEIFHQYGKALDSLERKYKAEQTALKQRIDSVKYLIHQTDDPSILLGQIKNYGSDSLKNFKWFRRLMAIKRFAVGRSSVDYSELTAKNISVTGVNAAYCNRVYFALSGGSVDYRYRDFMLNKKQRIPQYLLLARLGVGNINESGITATVFHGKKQAAWLNNNEPAVNHIWGLAVELRYRLDKNNFVLAEAAKSTYPAHTLLQNTDGASKKPALSDRTNEAYTIKLLSYIPLTQTRLSGQFKKMGIHFQSFNVYNINANYNAWQVKADQYLFKKAWFISASVKTNEYNSPYTIYNYKSSTLFTTVQTTLRLKKWPVISAALMPSAQWYRSGDDVIETRFSTLMASVNYMYRTGAGYMNTALLFNQFYNDRDQRQFMYYNASNWLFSHSIMGERLTLNTSAALSYNAGYRLQTIDQGAIVRFNKWLRAGGGMKWNRLNRINNMAGYYGSTQLKLKSLGELEFSFDHGFLPGLKGTLLPNDMGRIIYIKTF